ncbi:putative Ig domain-containing protein [Achromobacter xylosoxidans]
MKVIPIQALISALVLTVPVAVHAAQFFTVVPSPGKQGNELPAEDITLTLNAGAVTAGQVGKPYSHNLAPYLQVTGDPAYDPTKATWSADQGLPSGLTFSASGMLGGTPTAKNPGTEVVVTASYKDKSAQQTYTIIIDGIAFQASMVTAAGGLFSCAVTPAGALYCWGFNSNGQLGNGTTAPSSTPKLVPQLSSGVTHVGAGTMHACALKSGAVYCWGSNEGGRLGAGLAGTEGSSTPVLVSGMGSNVTHLSVGDSHSCAVRNGSAYCWGWNTDGALGNGTTTSSGVPVQVSGLTSGVTRVATGGGHSCAVVFDRAMCWGANDNGRLGTGDDGATFRFTTPQLVALTPGVTDISSNRNSATTCALKNDALFCWGANANGSAGVGLAGPVGTPAPVVGMTSGVTQVNVGSYHTCAVSNQAAYCWGNNRYGQLGNGNTSESNIPQGVVGLSSRVVQISAGNNHSCAVQAGGAKCWGLGTLGQLGNGESANKLTPEEVSP